MLIFLLLLLWSVWGCLVAFLTDPHDGYGSWQMWLVVVLLGPLVWLAAFVGALRDLARQ